jgi:DNA-binding PadR family transcriptional regulator
MVAIRGTIVRVSLAEPARDAARAKRSQLDYGVLSLVIEESSYGYEIGERFEALFGLLFPSTTLSGIYRALKRLCAEGLIQRSGVELEEGRSRIHYEATDLGARVHAEWVARSIREPPGHQEVLRRIASAATTPALLRIVEECERWCLAELTMISGQIARAGRVGTLAEEILRDERRTRAQAQLEWLSRARQRIDAEA